MIKCALSQSTSVRGLNPVRSGLEWNVNGHSLHHMTELCTCILARGWLTKHMWWLPVGTCGNVKST